MIKWLRILHRDFGYVLIGITLIFAISGLAVNHIRDWNPNHSINKETFFIGENLTLQDDIEKKVFEKLSFKEKFLSSLQDSTETYKIFLEDKVITVFLGTDKLIVETVKSRPILFFFNQLHLNQKGQLWNIISDLFCVILIFLALSGPFMTKGQWKRKLLYFLGGLLIPLMVYFF